MGGKELSNCPGVPPMKKHLAMKRTALPLLVTAAALLSVTGGPHAAGAGGASVRVDSPMPPPRWAQLERQLLDENLRACREFFRKYFDERGYLRCVVRWAPTTAPTTPPRISTAGPSCTPSAPTTRSSPCTSKAGRAT